MGLVENEEKKLSGINVESLIKWIGVLALLGGWIFTLGKKDNNADIVVQQLSEQRTLIQSLSDKVGLLSDRLARVEALQDSSRRDRNQDQYYQSHKN